MSNKAKKHWVNFDESGSVIGMMVMLYAYRIGGKLLFKTLLFPVVLFFFIVKRDQRNISLAYIERVQKFAKEGMPAPSLMNSFRIFWGFGESLIDKLGVWMGKLTIDSVEIHGDEIVATLLNSGNGAMMFVSHLGNFEVCQCLSARHKDMKLTVLHHTHNAEKFNHVLSKFNTQSHVDLVQIGQSDVALAMTLSKKISEGQMIAIAADRTSINYPETSMDLPFLGELAPFPQGPFALCNALGCEAFFVSCIKQGGKYHIYFEKIRDKGSVSRANRSQAIIDLAQRYAACLEKYTLKAPLQWYNFFSFWSDRDKS